MNQLTRIEAPREHPILGNAFQVHPSVATADEARIGKLILENEKRQGHRKKLPPELDRTLLRTLRQQVVLDFIRANPGCRRCQIVRGTNINDGYIGNLLSRLKQRKEIESRRDVRCGSQTYARYWVTGEQ